MAGSARPRAWSLDHKRGDAGKADWDQEDSLPEGKPAVIRAPEHGTNVNPVPKAVYEAEGVGPQLDPQDRSLQAAALTADCARELPHPVEHDHHQLSTPEEVAQLLKVSAEYVRALIRTGQLAAVEIGTGRKRPPYRIPASAHDEFLSGRQQPVKKDRTRRSKRRPHEGMIDLHIGRVHVRHPRASALARIKPAGGIPPMQPPGRSQGRCVSRRGSRNTAWWFYGTKSGRLHADLYP